MSGNALRLHPGLEVSAILILCSRVWVNHSFCLKRLTNIAEIIVRDNLSVYQIQTSHLSKLKQVLTTNQRRWVRGLSADVCIR